jgi:hypothetical protein
MFSGLFNRVSAEFALNWGCVVKYPTLEWASPLRHRISGKDGDLVEGYCMKDKRMVEMKDPQAVTMKNGKPATRGVCPNCGTTIFKIGKAK